MQLNWEFDIFRAEHWQFIANQWWYGGWIITGSYYWLFLLSLFLCLPVWILGMCWLLSINYTHIFEKFFWDLIYNHKTKKVQNPNKRVRVTRKKSKDKAADAEAEKPKKEELTLAQRSERLRAKLSPEKNFRLLKILIIVLSVICAAISAYVYIFVIYDKTTPLSIAKFVPIIPFIAQLLLLLITLLTAGTSKRRPIGAALKENIQIKQEVKEKEKDEKISKEISDHLLEPEVALNTTKRTVELSSFQIDNFYKKNIEEINGKYYMQVAKFDDSVKVFNALGATDMELCAVNMVGSAKFDEILNQPRTKTLSSQELATYFMSKPNVFTIKKRGSLDWTFKYSSKSFGIIRENDDSYKVSIKCYPDAAQRINDVYKALEDSNFPSGPLWYCFNELRNL